MNKDFEINSLRKVKLALITGALLLSQSVPLAAVYADDGSVRIAGEVAFVNKSASGSKTVDERTAIIQKNIDRALVATKDRAPSDVNIVYVKGVPVITVGGYQIVTVDSATAKAAGGTAATIAQKWADGIRNILKDKTGVDSYVAQLTGEYQASAPALVETPKPAPAPQQVAQVPVGQEQYNVTPQQPMAQPGYMPVQPGQQMMQPQYGMPAQQGYAQQQQMMQPQYGMPAQQGYAQQPMMQGQMMRGRVAYAPAGLVIPISLATSISTQVAKPGDLIQANISQPVYLGDSMIPAGSQVLGTIVDSKSGGFMGRSGLLEVKFNRLRTPDGIETPITAHLVGGIGKYMEKGGSDTSDTLRGETAKNKFVSAGLRTAVGAGAGAALGTAVGAIAGGSKGAGKGAWSGTAIGSGVGLADSLLLRKGKDVTIQSGQSMQLQLDAPVQISGGGGQPMTGVF